MIVVLRNRTIFAPNLSGSSTARVAAEALLLVAAGGGTTGGGATGGGTIGGGATGGGRTPTLRLPRGAAAPRALGP